MGAAHAKQPQVVAEDIAAIRAARLGDKDAGAALIRKYWHDAQRAAYVTALDLAASEDIAQEAMLSALENLDGFDEGRPFAPWLHRIVVNKALDWVRARSRRNELPWDDSHAVDSAGGPHGTDDRLVHALQRLEPEQRALVAMRYLLGYPEGEIAVIFSLPRGTVGSRLRRALDQMRKSMESER
jgi:RNA polymerase sigma-70 factor (ECF subfamily)